MRRRTPSATLTYPLFPSTSRFRSSLHRLGEAGDQLAAGLFRADDRGAADGFDRPAAGERGEPGGAGAGQLCIVGDAHLALQDVGEELREIAVPREAAVDGDRRARRHQRSHGGDHLRTEEHTSEHQSIMDSYDAVYSLKQNNTNT